MEGNHSDGIMSRKRA